ncbi:protein FAM43A-like [Branchiostoma floridae x Branchiostoma belcheri]
MFSKKKQSLDITPENPVFYVCYLGKVKTDRPNGKGCTAEPTKKIWAARESIPDRKLRKVALTITPEGMHMKEVEPLQKGTQPIDELFKIQNVSYCMADLELPKVFSWITGTPGGSKEDLFCHAVLCSKKQKAQAMVMVLTHQFSAAFRTWKQDASRQERKSSLKHSRKESKEKLVMRVPKPADGQNNNQSSESGSTPSSPSAAPSLESVQSGMAELRAHDSSGSEKNGQVPVTTVQTGLDVKEAAMNPEVQAYMQGDKSEKDVEQNDD